jgi:hypothetical protein
MPLELRRCFCHLTEPWIVFNMMKYFFTYFGCYINHQGGIEISNGRLFRHAVLIKHYKLQLGAFD